MSGDGFAEYRRNCIADLSSDLDLGPAEFVVERKGLEGCRF